MYYLVCTPYVHFALQGREGLSEQVQVQVFEVIISLLQGGKVPKTLRATGYATRRLLVNEGKVPALIIISQSIPDWDPRG